MRCAICILAALLLTGCFVFDELDQGEKILENHSPNHAAPAGPAKPDSEAGAGKTARQRLAEYYAAQRAKAAAPRESDDPGDAVGKCKIGDSVLFLRRSDCQLRRGVFL